MISIGRGIRWYNNYQSEIEFCRKHKFDFMQIWFKDGKLLVNDIPEPKEQYIKESGFPVIIHAVLDPVDFEVYGDRLLNLVEYLGYYNEVIVHPVSEKSPVNADTGNMLLEKVRKFSKKAKPRGIAWFLENNSVIDKFHYKKEELDLIFSNDDYVEQLLDIAHIDNYKHLEDIISVKFPKCLHVAGKHFDVAHEHLPLTRGDIDYAFVFQKHLRYYDGKIILEVDGSNEEIIQSKQIIDEAIQFLR